MTTTSVTSSGSRPAASAAAAIRRRTTPRLAASCSRRASVPTPLTARSWQSHPDDAGQAAGLEAVAAVGVEVGRLAGAPRHVDARRRPRPPAGRGRRRRGRGTACPTRWWPGWRARCGPPRPAAPAAPRSSAPHTCGPSQAVISRARARASAPPWPARPRRPGPGGRSGRRRAPGLGVGEQHRDAVGGAHHQGDRRLVGDHAVGTCVQMPVELVGRSVRAHHGDVVAVHLAEVGHGVAGGEVGEQATVVLVQGDRGRRRPRRG